MVIAYFTVGGSLSWRGDMPGSGKSHFTVRRQEVVRGVMRGDIRRGKQKSMRKVWKEE